MKLFYRELGSFDGRTLMIIHGWLGMSSHWLNIGRFLADCGYHVIIPDLPNHGRSFHTDMFSYDSMARFLHDFLRKHSSDKPILIGHSMGGKIAMKMLDLFHGKYEKCIIVDILPKDYPELMRQGGIADTILKTPLSQFEYRKDLAEYLQKYVSDKGWLTLLLQNIETKSVTHYPDTMETNPDFDETKRRFNFVKRPSAETKRRFNFLKWRSNAIMLAENMPKVAGRVDLQPVDTPTLLIRGSKSEFTEAEDLNCFSEVFTNSRIVTMEDCSHWLFVDKPALFLKEVCTYLDSI